MMNKIVNDIWTAMIYVAIIGTIVLMGMGLIEVINEWLSV